MTVAFAIAAILLVLTLVINLAAKLVGKQAERKSKEELTMDETTILSARDLDL